MKIIDDKGRIFEKVNIIDLLIVLFVIAALFAVNYKLGLVKNIKTIEETSQKHMVKIWVKDIAGYTVNAIKEGDVVKELRSNSDIGKIVKREVAPSKQHSTDMNGQWILSEVPERFDTFLTVETNSPGTVETLKLGSLDAKVGAQVTIKGPKFQVIGYVIEVE